MHSDDWRLLVDVAEALGVEWRRWTPAQEVLLGVWRRVAGQRRDLPQEVAWPGWTPPQVIRSELLTSCAGNVRYGHCWLVRSRQDPVRLYAWGTGVAAVLVLAARLRPDTCPELDAAAAVLLAGGEAWTATPPPRPRARADRR